MRAASLSVLVGVCLAGGQLLAQQVGVRTPFTTTNNSFFEQNSVSWSGNWGGVHFQFGTPTLATPTFGSPAPGAGLSTGFSINNGNSNLNFGLSLSQGARQSLVSQTPMLTLTNGQPGFMSDTSQTPFVIGQVPVVGGASPMLGNVPTVPAVDPGAAAGDGTGVPGWVNPQVKEMVQRWAAGAGQQQAGGGQAPVGNSAAAQAARRLFAAQESSAGRAAPSVAEARRFHELEQAAGAADLNVLMERARTAEEEGKPGVAKIYYQMVVKRASGDLKSQARDRLEALRTSTTR
ncbi:MAG: hypothetical protein ACLQLG_02370 [Thermoguttaceae bacterium]